MSAEQLMLRDFIYAVPELLQEADRGSPDFQRGVFAALRLLELKLQAFDIDQSRFARQMPDVQAWYY